ncbi:hypothetical protein [Nostoc sp. CHAB 5715]|uniref:hypothetical protein n=1 Tax=Nostoc sp. CHAB 5715 TaxID=2780400 RepID=UPI001E3425B1|nr:hypothetical protein [Nostoc sp. CHAB 5715]MCC5624590.1 hypothetical protein [Nostoc sp. CHAB 5715]
MLNYSINQPLTSLFDIAKNIQIESNFCIYPFITYSSAGAAYPKGSLVAHGGNPQDRANSLQANHSGKMNDN